MDCLEFRRRLGAEPRAYESELNAHREQCASCHAAWGRAQQAEDDLFAALQIPVPVGLAERVLLTQATDERRQQGRWRTIALALAASLVAAVGGSLLWRQLDARTLPALAVAHMPEEIHSLKLTRPISAQAIEAGFAARGLPLQGPLPTDVTYIHDCPVGPYLTVHLVSRVGDTSLAVLYVPGKQGGAGHDFHRGAWRGRVVQLRHGQLVMLTDQSGEQPFDAVANSVAQDWRVAIDGLAGPRVSEL